MSSTELFTGISPVGDAVTLSGASFAWPDGTAVFDDVSAVFPSGLTALIGRNGAGKSTLFRLITAELTPTAGSVTAPSPIGLLPQDITFGRYETVAAVLGTADIREALGRIESGSTDPADFAVIGDEWDVEARCIALLDKLGLPCDDLDRSISTLSGGQATLLTLAGLLLRNPATLLLDEPTNNLDAPARARLANVLSAFHGPVIIASHDLELLDAVSTTAELRAGELRFFGGPYSHYRQVIAAEQHAAARRVTDARRDLRKQKAEMVAARTTLDRRVRYGKKMQESKREPGVIMGLRQRQAQVSAGKLRGTHEADVDQATTALADAQDRVRSDKTMRLDIPECRLPPRREVASLGPEAVDHHGRSLLALIDDSAGAIGR